MNIDPVSSQILQPDPRAGTAFGAAAGVQQGHQVPAPELTNWQSQVTDAVQRLFATGTTAQRPANPVLGQVFYDTTLKREIVCTTVNTGNNTGDAVWTLSPGFTASFEVEQQVNQAIGAAAQTLVTFNTVVLDPRAWWNAGTSRWVPQIAGTYYFYAQLSYTPIVGLDYQLSYIRKNGVNRRPTMNTTTIAQLFSLPVSCSYAMNGTTDYVDAAFFSQGGGCTLYGAAFGTAYSYFGGYLLT